MSSVRAEAFFDYETNPVSTETEGVDVGGPGNIAQLYPAAELSDEIGVVTFEVIDEEVGHPETDAMGNQISDTKTNNTQQRLSFEQEKQLLFRAKMGDVESRDKLMEANKWVVLYLARRFEEPGVDFDDLAQEGHLALLSAIKWKDTDSAMRFSTYAYKGVRWAMLRVVEKSQSISQMTAGDIDDTDISEIVIDQSASEVFTKAQRRHDIGHLVDNLTGDNRLSEVERKALTLRYVSDLELEDVGREIRSEGDDSSQSKRALEMRAFHAIERALKKLRKEANRPFIYEWVEYIDEHKSD